MSPAGDRSVPESFPETACPRHSHAGNYCCLDLQQLSTNIVSQSDIAVSVHARVISTYPSRANGEVLIDAGGLAMSKDTGPFPEVGRVISPSHLNDWNVSRVSQEHGILVRSGDRGRSTSETRPVAGDVLRVVGQHACMILAAHPWYYVVEGDDVIRDVWVPVKGW